MEVGRSLGMTIHRLSRVNFENQSKALERLSSGLRINRAADDAAGLSISESFTSQVRGTQQAIRNAQDGINLLRTAEGAFSGIHDMLQRMRELCVQGGNGTLDTNARLAIQDELEQLKRQIDMTAYFTSYNGLNLLVNQDKAYRASDLPYTYSTAPAAGVWGNNTAAELQFSGPGSSVSGVTYEEFMAVKDALPALMEGGLRKAEGMLLSSGIDHTSIVPNVSISLVIDPTKPTQTNLSNGNLVVINLYPFLGSGVPPGGPQITLEQAFAQAFGAVLMQREDFQKTPTFGDFTAWTTTSGVAGQFESLAQIAQMGAGESYLGYGKPAAFSFDNLGADGGRSQAAWFYRYLIDNYGQGAADGLMHTIDNSNTAARGSIATNVQNYLFSVTGQTTYAGLETAVQTWMNTQAAPGAFSSNALSNTTSTAAQKLNTSLTLQVGANYGETMDLTLLAGALGNLDFASMANVMSQDSAARSLTTLDKAIAQVSDARTKLGASENRLEHTINRLATYQENSAAANSRIRDTDMADAMTEFTRSQILAQATLGSLKTFHQLQQEQTGSLLSGLS